MRLLIALLSIMAVVAALDYLYQYFEHIRRLRMSKREMREEMKQSEGDPLIKSRIRQLRMERARRRMMAQVPKADVVITNPTHFAVALKYEVGRMAAPILIAKGADAVAFKIREVAEANKIPIVENPPLARGLFASVELDEEIPAEHYKAVAEVIGYVMRLRTGRPQAPLVAQR
jgi:flagellar biosynthetic protein FlhB